MTIAIWYFFAYSERRLTVGPGTSSAMSHHFESCEGQKYGPLKTSCRQRICTPFLPASSMNGRCFSNIASRTAGTEAWGSLSGLLHWIRPPMTLRAMLFLSLEPALDDDLALGVEVDARAAVRLRVAEHAALLPAE